MIMNLAPFGVFALLLPVIAEDGSKLLMPLASVIACVAIASVVHVTGVYSVNQFMMILLTGTLASVGTAGVPGAGLIMLTMVLQSAGLPIEGIAIVAGIDRILDMFRTWVNNTGNSAVAAVVDRTVK